MGSRIEFRRDTSTNWTSVNPTLAPGEVGYETNTGFYKVGNGSTAWASLGYDTLTGPPSSSINKWFGDGSDGALTVSSSTTTSGPITSGALIRDAYFSN